MQNQNAILLPVVAGVGDPGYLLEQAGITDPGYSITRQR
jgi:hypothetical protein